MKNSVISGALLLVMMMGLGFAASGQRVLGGYSTISKDDPEARAAAEFAVSKQSEEQEGLKLDSINTAESQSTAGRNFRLCITVSLDDETQQVKTVVSRNLKAVFKVLSWDVVNSCDGGPATSAMAAAAPGKPIRSCLGTQLSLTEAEANADIGGKRYGNYVFTNISSRTCVLRGFPTFIPLNRAGRAYPGINVEYTNDYPNGSNTIRRPGSVTLQPGKKAWFQIYYNDGMALEHRKPYPVVRRVKISAPKTSRRFLLKSSIQTCCGIQVSSVRKGTPN